MGAQLAFGYASLPDRQLSLLAYVAPAPAPVPRLEKGNRTMTRVTFPAQPRTKRVNPPQTLLELKRESTV